MKPRVYIETSVISYLVSRPALDVITVGHQATTWQWWEQHRSRFELVISQFVVDEASQGDPVAAEKRLAVLAVFLWYQSFSLRSWCWLKPC